MTRTAHEGWLRRVPIGRKLRGMILLACAVALVLAGTAFVGFELARLRGDLEHELESLGDVLGSTSTAALEFDDAAGAREILAALGAQPRIVAATLGRGDGTVLASYRRAGTPAAADAVPEPDGRDRGWRVTVTRPVMLDGRQIGTIALTGEPGDVWGRIWRYLLIAGAVLATALGAAYALSTVLERIVSRPLAHLAATASEVSDRGDYSLRARRESSDEIGILVERFNEMLDQIEQRDRAVQDANELLAAKNAELERFTYTVSHDLKSPLVTIKGFLGLLERDTAALAGDRDTAERVRHDLRRIHSAADKMQQLLEKLLHLSRMIHQAVEPEAVELDRLAREALELVAGAVAERRVEVEIDPALPVVMGDRTRLREVYQNLLVNAVKYMGGQAAPRVEVGMRRQGQETVFTVRDNGSGIEARHRDKIFGLFERLETGEEGTGIGLAVVRRIVELHGGRVWVESDGPGRGSTFCFTLPQRNASAEGRAGRGHAGAPWQENPDGRGRRIGR